MVQAELIMLFVFDNYPRLLLDSTYYNKSRELFFLPCFVSILFMFTQYYMRTLTPLRIPPHTPGLVKGRATL